MSEVERTVIIGSGPAGFAAAIYAARANLKPLLFEGTVKPEMIPLGQLAFTTEVENYPGFPAATFARSWRARGRGPPLEFTAHPQGARASDGRPHYAVQGVELMELMKQQALNFGTRIVSDDVVEVEFGEGQHTVVPGDGQPVKTKTLIIATGARANWLGLESEEKYKNRGVSACAVCDGAIPIYRRKPLAVIGGGDTAVEEASYLANLDGAETIYLVHRRDELRASKVMQERAFKHPKIELVWNSVVDEVLGDDQQVTGLRLRSTADDSTSELKVAGMFVAIGHTPNTSFLKGKLEMNSQGYIKWTEPFRTKTSVPGVFAAGDVADDYYRQAITSAGTGCMAALGAERYLAECHGSSASRSLAKAACHVR